MVEILLLESKNIKGEVLRLQKDIDKGEYSILRGEYVGSQGRFQLKGVYGDLANVLGVYFGILRNFIKDYE